MLLGNGDGTFQPAKRYAAVGLPGQALVAGDFTGDGRLDLAVTQPAFGNISMLLGNGDGTFQARRDHRAGVEHILWWPETSTATAASTWPRQTSTTTTSRCC